MRRHCLESEEQMGIVRGLAVALVLAAVPSMGSGQEAPLRLTLSDAVRLADEQSLRIAELRARAEGAEAAVAARQAADFPVVGLVGGYTRTNHVDEFAILLPGGQSRLLYPDVPDNYRARLDLQWPIYTAGRVRALEGVALAERDAARLDIAAARADVRLEATRAFWALVTARETRAVLASAVDSADAHLRQLQAQQEQGLIPPNEVLSARAQRARQRVAAIEAENLRAIAEADLRRAIGDDSRRPIEPVDDPEPPPGPVESDAHALAAAAREGRPERRALAVRAAASGNREAAAAAAGRPQVALGAGYDYARPNPRIFPRLDAWRDSWDVSVNVSWSLWDGGRRRAEEAEAAAATRVLIARASEFDRHLAFEVEQRSLELQSAYAAIGAAEEGVSAAVEARRVLGERFAAGVATSADVLSADTAVLQARLERTRVLAKARLAAARLDRSLGR